MSETINKTHNAYCHQCKVTRNVALSGRCPVCAGMTSPALYRIDPVTLFNADLAPKANDPVLWTREGETQLAIVHPEAGICKHCDKPLTNAWFAWNRRITHEMCRPGDWKLGEDAFQCRRHTDGSPLCVGFGSDESPKARCGNCGTYDTGETFKLEQLPYHDRVTCTACGDVNMYSIGD